MRSFTFINERCVIDKCFCIFACKNPSAIYSWGLLEMLSRNNYLACSGYLALQSKMVLAINLYVRAVSLMGWYVFRLTCSFLAVRRAGINLGRDSESL